MFIRYSLFFIFSLLIIFCFDIFFYKPTIIQNEKVVDFVLASSTLPIVSEEKIILPKDIYFLGDIMLARDVERKILLNGFDYPFSKISFNEDSFVVGNFESSIPLIHIPTPGNTFRFSTKADLSGYENTLTEMQKNSLVAFGHPSVISTSSVTVIETQSGSVGILAIHTLFEKPNRQLLKDQINNLKSYTDLQIVYIHWGDEYIPLPHTNQRELAEFFVAEGVDLIIGHHPHIVQSIEKISGVPVIYSLGNFIFDQYFSRDVQRGLVLRFSFTESPYIELLPISSEGSKASPYFLEGEAKMTFLTELVSISDDSIKEELLTGLINLNNL